MGVHDVSLGVSSLVNKLAAQIVWHWKTWILGLSLGHSPVTPDLLKYSMIVQHDDFIVSFLSGL